MRAKRIPKPKKRKRPAILGWISDPLDRPWTVKGVDGHLVFRRYSSQIKVTVSLKEVLQRIVLERLPSHLRVVVIRSQDLFDERRASADTAGKKVADSP